MYKTDALEGQFSLESIYTTDRVVGLEEGSSNEPRTIVALYYHTIRTTQHLLLKKELIDGNL